MIYVLLHISVTFYLKLKETKDKQKRKKKLDHPRKHQRVCSLVFFSFLLFSFLGGAEPYSWTLHSNATFISVWKCESQGQAVSLTLLTHPS